MSRSYRRMLSCLLIVLSQINAHRYSYDVAVIGAGSSGMTAAKAAANMGKNVLLIQDADMQQARMLTGLVPLNALIYAGQVASDVQRSHEFGLSITESLQKPAHLFSYVAEVTEQVQHLFKINHHIDDNIQVVNGHASFEDSHTLNIDEHTITADKIIIATGGKPFIPSIEGVDSVPYLTEDSLCNQHDLPDSIIIAGEGPLGIELATALHRLGVKVTFITTHATILPKYDFELVSRLQSLTKASGVKVKCLTEIKRLTYENGIITAHCKNNLNLTSDHSADAILFAFSRSGVVDGMHLDAVGIQPSVGGITVNKRMQTKVPNIYACGSVVSQLRTLSRVSLYQAQIAGHNAARSFWQQDLVADYANISTFVRAIRPLGSTGLTEQEARKIYGRRVKIYRYNYSSLIKAHIERHTDGIAKFICDESGTLLGAHVLGEGADIIIDNVRIGLNFADQFKDYLLELRTSPNYLDLVWAAAKRSASDCPKGVLSSFIDYIKGVVR